MKTESFVQGFLDELSKDAGLSKAVRGLARKAKGSWDTFKWGVSHGMKEPMGIKERLKSIREVRSAQRKGLDHDFR